MATLNRAIKIVAIGVVTVAMLWIASKFNGQLVGVLNDVAHFMELIDVVDILVHGARETSRLIRDIALRHRPTNQDGADST